MDSAFHMSSCCHVSPFAGTWYPGDAADLQRLLSEAFAESEHRTGPCLLSRPLAFVVPHAGIRYSGVVAASVYRYLQATRPRRAIILGFPHRGTPGGLCIPDATSYSTPLGDTLVDEDAVARLTSGGVFRRVREAIACDHSLEIQLPLLRYASPETALVPISVGTLSAEERSQAADLLASLAADGTPILASSDFTHYGHNFRYRPFPPDTAVRDRLRELDAELAEAAGSLKVTLFERALAEHQSTLCGVHPISLLLETLRRLDSDDDGIYQQTLDYQTSGELGGSFEHSVSYCSLAYFRHSSFAVPELARAWLLSAAFQALRRAVAGGVRSAGSPKDAPADAHARISAFATVYVRSQLRGCIGACFQPRPLVESIPDLAVAAALEDDRFAPLRPNELEDTEIEISLLTPFRRITGRQEWRAGIHGALLRNGARRGLLLPQVATERGWGAGEFFHALARKAVVPEDVYTRPDTRLSIFGAHCFRGACTGRE
jgi:AmmeMemoRadiSam system protein B/AmmeMemoRadiSam system protein A